MAEHANPDISGAMSGEGRTGLETPLLKIVMGYRVGAAHPTLTGALGPLPDKLSEVHDEHRNPGLTLTPAVTIAPNTPSTAEATESTEASQAKTSGGERSNCPVGLENYTSVGYICTADENTFYHPGTPAWSTAQNHRGPIVLPRRFSDTAFNSMNEYWGFTEELTLGNGRPLGLIGQVEDSDGKSEPYCLSDGGIWDDDTAFGGESSFGENENEDPFEYDVYGVLFGNDENDEKVNPFEDVNPFRYEDPFADEGLFETDSHSSPFDNEDDTNPFGNEASSCTVIRRRFVCGSCGEAEYHELSRFEDEDEDEDPVEGGGANMVFLCGLCGGVQFREVMGRRRRSV